ncbi:MAG: hypothetical protein OIF32_01760, partial [Campylobacterales bacterium]|nr:hypothetical protein [Campylobacterales bacterium]
KAKKKGDDKQVELLKKKEKLLENVIRKQEKYIDTLTKKEAEKPDNKPQKNIMIKEENRVAYPVLKPEIKKVQTPLIPQKVGEKKDFFKQKVSSNRAVNQQVKNIEIIENNLAKNKKEIIEKAPVDNSEKLAVIDEIQKKIEYKKQQAKNTGNKRELKRLQRKERALKRRADILRKEDRKAQLEYEKKVKDIEEKPEAIQKENKQLTKVDSQEKNKFYGVTLGSSLATVTSKWNTTPPRKNEPQTSMTSSLGAYGGYKKSNLRGLASFDYHLWSNSSLILLTLQGDYIFPQSIYNGNIFAGAFGGLGVFETQLTGSSGSGSVFGADFGYIQTIGKEFELEVGIKYIMPSIETSDSDHNVFLESIFNTYFGVNKKF